MKKRIHYFSEWCEEHNYYSSQFVFPEASALLDIQYQLEGSPVKEKQWLWWGDVLNTGWQLLADVRFLVIQCRQQTVSRNFNLSILKPTRYKRKRKKSSCSNSPHWSSGVFPLAMQQPQSGLMKLGGEVRLAAPLSLTVLASCTHTCMHEQAHAHMAPFIDWLFAPSSLQGGEQRSTSQLLVAVGNERSSFVSLFLPSPWTGAFCEFPFATFLSVLSASLPPQQFPFFCFLPRG